MTFLPSRSWLFRVFPVLLLLTVTGYASVHRTTQLLASNSTISDAVHVRYAARDLLFSMIDLETGMRGFVITGDEAFLEPFNSSSAAAGGQIDKMSRLLGNDPRQRQRITELRTLVAAEIAASQRLVALRRVSGAESASLAVKTGDTKPTMDRIRWLIAEVLDAQDKLLDEQGLRGEYATRQARNILLTIVIGNTTATTVVIVASYLVYEGDRRRKRAEEELIQSESRFRWLVDNAKEYAIFLLDREGRIKTWNAGAKRIKGYRAEEIIGRHFSCFYPNGVADREMIHAKLETALTKGQFEGDGWRVRKDGTRFWANVVIAPVYDQKGAHIGFSKITRDLTERKRVEEEVHRFFTLSLDLLCIVGTDGYFKRLNPAWETTLGYTDEELRSSPYIDFVHVDDRPATLAKAAILSEGQPVVQFENRFRCKDGSYRWMLWKSAGSGDRQLIYAAASDITDRKAAENAIAELSRASQLRNMELEAANKELESFSYSVSHDLRTPLRSIDGFSQALLEDYGDKFDLEGQETLHRIRAASQRMGQLIDDLLNLSRVTRVEMSRETVAVSKMAREVAEELRGSEDWRDVEFVIADQLFANTDARLLRIVLTNLLGNAWKFTGKRARARIEFGCSREDGTDTYFVRDNGAGFNMQYAAKLFGAFQRLHGATEFPGTGIGLATVQRIVRRCGGRVWAEGEPDGGATFHFTLQPPLLCSAA